MKRRWRERPLLIISPPLDQSHRCPDFLKSALLSFYLIYWKNNPSLFALISFCSWDSGFKNSCNLGANAWVSWPLLFCSHLNYCPSLELTEGQKALIDSFFCSWGLEPNELQGIRTGGGPCLALRKGLYDFLPLYFCLRFWRDSNFIFSGHPNGLNAYISPIFSSSLKPTSNLDKCSFL